MADTPTDIIACEPPEVWIEHELQEMYNSDTDPGVDSSDLEKGGGSQRHPQPQQRRFDPSVSQEWPYLVRIDLDSAQWLNHRCQGWKCQLRER